MNAAQYRRRKVAGVCVYSPQCGQPIQPDSLYCPRHARHVPIQRARRMRAKWRRERAAASTRRFVRGLVDAGLCIVCRSPVSRQKHRCDSCADKEAIRRKDSNAKRALAARPAPLSYPVLQATAGCATGDGSPGSAQLRGGGGEGEMAGGAAGGE